MHFAASRHGALTIVEALTTAARRFLASFGFSNRVALTYGDFRELRYAANAAGLGIEVAR